MAYKNVHRRIQGLLKNKLISEIIFPNGFKHGAKNYTLTGRGLVYLYSTLWAPRSIKAALYDKDNILFQTFVYPFFEHKTLRNATPTLELLIDNLITGCCQTTVSCSELLDDYIVGLKNIRSKFDLLGILPMGYMHYRLSSDILMFIIKCAITTKEFESWEDYDLDTVGSSHLLLDSPIIDKHSRSKDEKLQTRNLLAGDKKFMKALSKARELVIPSFEILNDLKLRQ